ncbi:MAG: hypothetical protein J5J00_16340 [Deltaproteobacteria bacterium]|nr:hypothetical protein [Deltaproteobacteria bacterium]
MADNQDKHELSTITQISYEPTKYEDATWEVVGELIDEQEFNPLELEVLKDGEMVIDPMFADYGGIERDASSRRWHLPEHLASEEKRRAAEEREAAARKNVFSDEELNTLLQDVELKARQSAMEELVLKQHERFTAIEERLKTILQDLTVQVKEQILEIERNSVELAINISNKVTNYVVEVVPEYIAAIVKEALEKSGSASISKIKVSPQDLEFIEIVGIQKHLEGLDGGWSFEADPSIKSGCVVETTAGEVDYQLDRAWEQVKENILKVIR